MDSTSLDNLEAPRFETGKPLLVAGIGERYITAKTAPAFPASGSVFISRSTTSPAGSER